jgi:hypothetical protein
MDDQFEFFNLDDHCQLRHAQTLANLRNSIRLGFKPFSVDNLQKASTMYGVLCDIVLRTYQEVTNEKPSNNSKSGQRSPASKC